MKWWWLIHQVLSSDYAMTRYAGKDLERIEMALRQLSDEMIRRLMKGKQS